jgi:hypothetical protein
MTGLEFAGFLFVVAAPWILTAVVWAWAAYMVGSWIAAMVK